jgi:PAS domain S-box-containing protein
MLGRDMGMLVPERLRDPDPARRPAFTAHPRLHLRGVGPQLYGLRKDGSEFPMEVSLSPLETEQGVLISSTILDITARKRAHEEIHRLNVELKQQAENLHFVLNGIREGVVAIDGNGAVVLTNPAARRILDGTPEQVSDQDRPAQIEAYLPGQSMPSVLETLPIKRALRGETICEEIVFLRQRQSGNSVWLSVTAGPVEASGPLLGAVAIFRDVTENKRHEAELADHIAALDESNRALKVKTEEINAFYNTVSHELKTPLTSTREFIALVLDGVAGKTNRTQREYLEFAKEGCEQIAHCINDLLEVTKAEAGQMEVQLQPMELAPLVRWCSSSLNLAMRAKLIRFSLIEEPGEVPAVMADRRRITQVLLNLLSNAVKFTPEGGDILLTIFQDPTKPDLVFVSVNNTGEGIAPEYLERVFDRLFQIKRSDYSGSEGMGLGLCISRHIIQAHGGSIWAESGLGKSVTFTFSLKKQNQAGRAAAK